ICRGSEVVGRWSGYAPQGRTGPRARVATGRCPGASAAPHSHGCRGNRHAAVACNFRVPILTCGSFTRRGSGLMALAPMPATLRDKYPNLERFWPFLQTLHQESPRGIALISCGYIEEQLKDILLAFMLDHSSARELVEGQNAPLGTLSSRIGAAYLLG